MSAVLNGLTHARLAVVDEDVLELEPVTPTLAQAEAAAQTLLRNAWWAMLRGDRSTAQRRAQEALGQLVLADAIQRWDSRPDDDMNPAAPGAARDEGDDR